MVLISLVVSTVLHGQAASYFATAYGKEGEPLKTHLGTLIEGHTSLSYTPGVWDAHKDLYEDPNDSSKLILFYSQASREKSAQDNGSSPSDAWNREHLWPRSYGVGSSGADNTDLFHLVPVYKGVNSSRGNKYFDYSDPAGSGYRNPAHSLAPDCTSNTATWEPGDGQKGWAARAILYMTTRYTYLDLVDTPPSTAPNSSSTRMAQLSVMLEWNRTHLPTVFERTTNQRIHDDYQGNRNPYIDFPEFADAIWITGPSWGGWRLEHFTLTELLNPAISSDLADPDRDGLSNLMEMARYSDPRTPEAVPAISGSLSGSTLTLSFQRASDFSNLNLALILEASGDFKSWDPVSLSGATITTLDAQTESVSLTITLSPASPRFYRLSVKR